MDPLLQLLTESDRKLIVRYSDCIHDNDGKHLDGGVKDDSYWQQLYDRVTNCSLPLWDLPSTVGTDFLLTLTQLLQDTRERKCNSKKLTIFAPCILRKTRGKKTFAETKPLIRGRLEAWKNGHYLALVKDIEEANLEDGWGTAHDREFELEEAGKKYDSMIKRGQVRSAVRVVTNRDLGGLYLPTDTCTKTGRTVIDILREKHPEPTIPDESQFNE